LDAKIAPQGVGVARDFTEYRPSTQADTIDLSVFSTARGGNYGQSSAAVQLSTLERTIFERHRLGLPFEVEWTQLGRSSMLTWFLCNALKANFRLIRRLNIRVLFGFSPRLEFPKSYEEFKAAIAIARSIADIQRIDDNDLPIKISVTCGASVLPQHANRHVRQIDVGPLSGRYAGPLDRLIAYACQADSEVDVLRCGMEGTPFILDPAGVVLPATNLLLAERTVQQIDLNGAEIITDAENLQKFVRISNVGQCLRSQAPALGR